MKYIIVATVCLLVSFNSIGQIGIIGGFKNLSATEWTDALNRISNDNFSSASGYAIGLDYRLTVKDIRIEFYPEISFASLKDEGVGTAYEYSHIGFHFNTSIYPFDLEGDCDCPTWSKSGNIFQKGFFLQISPGINNMGIEAEGLPGLQSDRIFFWDIGIGAGLDIGVSEFLTITPTLRYYLAPGAKWQYSLAPDTQSIELEANARQFFAGLKVGFRLKR